MLKINYGKFVGKRYLEGGLYSATTAFWNIVVSHFSFSKPYKVFSFNVDNNSWRLWRERKVEGLSLLNTTSELGHV